MNKQEWIDEFAGKRILVWGYGMEGKSSVHFLETLLPEQEIWVADTRKKGESFKEEIRQTHDHCIPIFEDEIDYDQFDMVLKAPGIVVPEKAPLGKLTGQAPLFLKHYRDRVIGVTGTKGKSTTTTIIAAVLGEKYRTHLVGNIGKACFDVIPEMEDDDLVAFEISCHQLELSPYSPHVAVYLNLFEEHLDHYGSFAKYGTAKDQIFLHQKEGDILIIGQGIAGRADRDDALVIGRDVYASGHTVNAGSRSLTIKDCALIGDHNYANLAVAYEIAALYGISDDAFLHAAKEFAPLQHRLQYLGKYEGIGFVDDSISTIGQSCIQAVRSLPDTDTVLVGGMDRGIDYADLEEFLYAEKELKVVFMYATGRRIYSELQATGRLRDGFYPVEDLEQAVETARRITRVDHLCVLSPAASSYDHFKNFEERGDIFRRLAFRL